jgi:hypothetical protein
LTRIERFPNSGRRHRGTRVSAMGKALLGLVLSLDDDSFLLHPEASDSDTVRKDGKPYSLRLA